MKLLVTRTLLFVGVLFVVVVVFVSRFSPCVLLPGDSWWHSVATRFVCFCFEFLSFLQCSLVSPRRASYTHALVSSVTHGLLGWFSQQVTSVLHSPRKCTTCRHKTRCATRSIARWAGYLRGEICDHFQKQTALLDVFRASCSGKSSQRLVGHGAAVRPRHSSTACVVLCGAIHSTVGVCLTRCMLCPGFVVLTAGLTAGFT